jgi:hypothetical protein
VWDVHAATNGVKTPFWKYKSVLLLANSNILSRRRVEFSATKSAFFQRISLQVFNDKVIRRGALKPGRA